MPELHSNGIHEAYLAELFNPMAAGAALNSGVGIGGAGTGQQTPWMSAYPQQAFPQQSLPSFAQPNTPWAQPPTQPGAIVQQIAAKQAVQAFQLSHVLQALQQIVHTIAVQQQHLVQALVGYAALSQPGAYGTQAPFGQNPFTPSPFTSGAGATPFGPTIGQIPGLGAQNPGVTQALQQQAMQQLLQYLGVQQPQTPFRYGMAV